MSKSSLRFHSAAPANPSMIRIWETEADRWTAMGQSYASQREQIADAARWTAMGDYYIKMSSANAGADQRSLEADAARWTAMGQYYNRVKAASIQP